ncbi:hypothetical protein D9M70_515200 [compost metagenome]
MTISQTHKRRAKQVLVEEIHDNTSQEIISITTDKLRLALIDHLDKVNKKNSWHMPLSLLVGVIVVFCSSNFKQALGLSPDSWAAIFALFGVFCALWLVKALAERYSGKKGTTLDDLILTIKNKA